jgi:L-lactate dehydrogenase complex protein LldG
MLERIEAALADHPAPVQVPRDYRRRGERGRADVVALFAERAGEYQATVRRAARGELTLTLAELAAEAGARRMAVPTDLPSDWRPDGVELVVDEGLSASTLDGVDGALTGCALAIAEPGAIVLDAGPGQGRRALTLVPDYHLCVVLEESIVELVPEAVERLAAAISEGRPLTFIAGPSATSDIELNRVEGVHGPRTLHVVVVSS